MLKIKLRSKTRKQERQPTSTADNDEANISKKSNKQKMKEYRQRLKENPDTYKTYLQSEAERNKIYRENLSEEKKAKQRELTRLRVQKYREKQKSQLSLKDTPDSQEKKEPKTPKTRQKVKEQREYWRKKKQDQRQIMTAQKKRRINEKRRQNYAEKKETKKLIQFEKQSSTSSVSPGYTSKEAERKAIYRAKKSLPTSPNKFASVLSGIAAMATPRKRAALDKDGTVMTPSKRRRLNMYDKTVGKLIADVKSKKYTRSKQALQRRRILASSILWSRRSNLRKEYGMSWTFAYKCSTLDGVWDNKKRSDALDQSTIKAVEDFFKQPSNSTCLPDKKQVSKKTLEPKIILDKSLQDTYKQFREQNKDCNISFSKFSSLRPSNVKTMDKNTFNNCLCEYCTNIELKIKATSKILGNRAVLKNRYDILRQTLCPKLNGMQFYQKKCIERKCEQCGTGQLKATLKDLLRQKCTSIEWHRWENQTLTDSEKKKTRKMLKAKKENIDVFINELSSEIEPFCGHIHNASWQHGQFSNIIKNIPEKWVIFCMDFAENYTCLYQDEAQSAHWSHNTVTLFSIVAYYLCPLCRNPMSESMMFITTDKKHDSHAVHHFVSVANTYLKDKGIHISREIHFSDGAPGQFKSKTPFADVSKSIEDYGFQIEKHFFGTRHGKGPCDGEFGVVKRSVSNSVVARSSIVSDAKEFYKYGRDELSINKGEANSCCHKQRSFFLVDEKDIRRKRQDRIEVKAVPDTRKQHGIKSDAKGNLVTRLLSCFCDGCTLQTGECINKDHVDSWEGVRNQTKTGKQKALPVNKTCRKRKTNNVKPTIKRKKEDPKSRKVKVEGVKIRDKPNNDRIKDQTVNAKNIGQAVEFRDFPSITTAVLPGDRRGYFCKVLQYLQSSTSYNDLQAKCIEINELTKFQEYTLVVDKNINMVINNLIADKQAMGLIPKDALCPDFTSWLPVQVMGDGNCLPRSASIGCFGEETDHKEIRARIIIEMCLHEGQYTDNVYLNRGIELPRKEADTLVKTYTMFSEQYTAGDKITKAVINRVYQAEALEAVKSGQFMGIWQLFALSSCLNSVITSIYPDLGDRLPKLTLHRKILPRASLENHGKLVVMWSSTRNDMTTGHWIPNHFVPLIPSYQSNIDLLDDTDEDDGFALDDSVMITLLQTVTDVTFDDEQYTTEDIGDVTGTCSNLVTLDDHIQLEVGPKPGSATTIVDKLLEDVTTKTVSSNVPISFTFDDNYQHTTDDLAYDTGHNIVDVLTPLEVEPKEPPDVSAQTSGDQSIVDVSTNDASSNGPISVTFDDNQHTTDELAYDTGHIIVDVHTPLEVEPKEDVAQPSDISASTTGDKSIVDVSTNDSSSNGPISVTFDNDKYTTNKLVDNTGTCDHLIAVEVLGPLEVEPKEDARQPADASAPTTGDQSIADVSTNDASGSGPISFTFDDNQHTTDVPAYDTGHNIVDVHTPLEVEPKEDVAQPPDVSAQTSGDQSIVEVSTNDASSNGPISVTFDDNQHITDGLAYDTGHIIVDVHTSLEVKPKEVVAQSPVVSAPTSGNQSIVDVSTNDASSNGPISYQLTGTYLLVAHGVNSFPAVVTDWPWVKFYSHQKRSTEWWIENEKEHIIIDEDVLQTLEAPTILMKGRRKYYSFRDLGTSGQ